MQRCWPSDHSLIEPSELPDKHCSTQLHLDYLTLVGAVVSN